MPIDLSNLNVVIIGGLLLYYLFTELADHRFRKALLSLTPERQAQWSQAMDAKEGLWRTLNALGLILLLAGLINVFIKSFLPGYGISMCGAGVVYLCVIRAFRGFYRMGLYIEAGGRQSGNTQAALFLNLLGCIGLGLLVFNQLIMPTISRKFLNPKNNTQRSSANKQNDSGVNRTSDLTTAQTLWIDRNAACELLNRDEVYLDTLIAYKRVIRTKLEDGNIWYRRDDLQAALDSGLLDLETMREELKE